MTGWDIASSGVDSVLGRVGVAADGLNESLRLYATCMDGAAGSVGTLSDDPAAAPPTHLSPIGGEGNSGGGQAGGGLVAAALAEFAKESDRDVRFLIARPQRTIAGTVEATVAYANGQLEQAWNAQRQATLAPDLNDMPGMNGKRGGE
ncbi:DUF6507 family protein [Streptomyces sp. NPDC002851]